MTTVKLSFNSGDQSCLKKKSINRSVFNSLEFSQGWGSRTPCFRNYACSSVFFFTGALVHFLCAFLLQEGKFNGESLDVLISSQTLFSPEKYRGKSQAVEKNFGFQDNKETNRVTWKSNYYSLPTWAFILKRDHGYGIAFIDWLSVKTCVYGLTTSSPCLLAKSAS